LYPCELLRITDCLMKRYLRSTGLPDGQAFLNKTGDISQFFLSFMFITHGHSL
jgi:hypothetical protein